MTRRDLRAVMRLERELFAEDAWAAGLLRSELDRNDTRHYVVALDERDRVIGYAGLCVYPDQSHVMTMAVRPDRRRTGVGSMMLRNLLAVARERGTREIILEVRADNDEARRLYERHGFAAIGLRERYYQPSGTDAVVMRRDVQS